MPTNPFDKYKLIIITIGSADRANEGKEALPIKEQIRANPQEFPLYVDEKEPTLIINIDSVFQNNRFDNDLPTDNDLASTPLVKTLVQNQRKFSAKKLTELITVVYIKGTAPVINSRFKTPADLLPTGTNTNLGRLIENHCIQHKQAVIHSFCDYGVSPLNFLFVQDVYQKANVVFSRNLTIIRGYFKQSDNIKFLGIDDNMKFLDPIKINNLFTEFIFCLQKVSQQTPPHETVFFINLILAKSIKTIADRDEVNKIFNLFGWELLHNNYDLTPININTQVSQPISFHKSFFHYLRNFDYKDHATWNNQQKMDELITRISKEAPAHELYRILYCVAIQCYSVDREYGKNFLSRVKDKYPDFEDRYDTFKKLKEVQQPTVTLYENTTKKRDIDTNNDKSSNNEATSPLRKRPKK